MRIGLTLFELTASGGEQRQILRLAQGLRRQGHDVPVYTYRYSPSACFPELASGLEIHAVHVLNGDTPPTVSTSAPRLLSVAARRYFLESRLLARAIPKVDILNAHSRPAHRAAAFAKQNSGTVVVWSCNDLVGWEKPGHRARMAPGIHRAAARAMKPLEQRIVHQFDGVAVLTGAMRRSMLETYGLNARVIRPGVDCDFFTERPESGRELRNSLNIRPDTFLALWLGVLEPFRRLEDLLGAAILLRAQAADVHCLIAGSSDFAPAYAEKLKRFVAEHGLEQQVTILDQSVAEKSLPAYYSACDAFIFPNDQQSWGLAPLEALSCRRPVVVSRGSGVTEALCDGETALLVPPRSPEALASAILSLRNNCELRKHISQQGRDLVARELSWTAYVAEMAELFSEIWERPKCRSRSASIRQHCVDHLVELSEPLWRVR